MLGISILPAVMKMGRRSLRRQGVLFKGVTVDGMQVNYVSYSGRGRGLPMLLVHGLAGSSLSWSRCMMELSSYSSQLVALDIPGAGLSPTPGSGPLRFDQMVDVVEGFARQVMPERFILVGASMGAAIATRASLRMKERVAALSLVVPGGARVPEERVPEQLERLTIVNKQDAKRLVSRLFATQSRVRDWALTDDAYHLYNQPWVQALVQEATNGARSMVLQEEELSSIETPTSLYWAKEEHLLLEDGISYFRRHLPGHVVIEELEGVGHCAHIEKPRLIAERMITFFTKKRLHPIER